MAIIYLVSEKTNIFKVKKLPIGIVIFIISVLFGGQSVYKKESGLTGMYYDYAMAAPFMTELWL